MSETESWHNDACGLYFGGVCDCPAGAKVAALEQELDEQITNVDESHNAFVKADAQLARLREGVDDFAEELDMVDRADVAREDEENGKNEPDMNESEAPERNEIKTAEWLRLIADRVERDLAIKQEVIDEWAKSYAALEQERDAALTERNKEYNRRFLAEQRLDRVVRDAENGNDVRSLRAELARLREAVRELCDHLDYWLPDETMIPRGHEGPWDAASTDLRHFRALAVEQGEPEPCEMCGGSGTVALGEHFVTQDMATDAGEPDMVGMSMGVEYGPCPACAAERGEPNGRQEEVE